MSAKSKSQQRLMAQAYEIKKGELKPEDLNPAYRDEIVKLADSMTMQQLKDFAETSHKGLKENTHKMKHIKLFEQFINEQTAIDKLKPNQKVYVATQSWDGGIKKNSLWVSTKKIEIDKSDDGTYEFIYLWLANPNYDSGTEINPEYFDEVFREVDLESTKDAKYVKFLNKWKLL